MISELEAINLQSCKQEKEKHHPELTCSNLSLFLTCCATKRDASIVFSISRYDGFSNVGLTSPQQFGLKSLIPGLKSSSSPLDNGNGSAGSGGSPKREGGNAVRKREKKYLFYI
jgi:hypothetical protein